MAGSVALTLRNDGRFSPENGLCRTKYVDEPRFRGFCLSPRLPRVHKFYNGWRQCGKRQRKTNVRIKRGYFRHAKIRKVNKRHL